MKTRSKKPTSAQSKSTTASENSTTRKPTKDTTATSPKSKDIATETPSSGAPRTPDSYYELLASIAEKVSTLSIGDNTAPLPPRKPSDGSKQIKFIKALFSPVESVPAPSDLKSQLAEPLVKRIPIRNYYYSMLMDTIDTELVASTFVVEEEAGCESPLLSSRVENAISATVDSSGTESLQQYAVDAFLMSIFGTAKDLLSESVRIDRNKSDTTMTLPRMRPDFLCWINGKLVFKGEEKKRGNVREIAKELTEKMTPGSVGCDAEQRFLLGYATAGTHVLFECIYGDGKMVECSDILDIAKPQDRVAMIVTLVNVMRIARAL